MHAGKAWEIKVEGNSKTFEEVYNANANADPSLLEKVAADCHSGAWAAMTH